MDQEAKEILKATTQALAAIQCSEGDFLYITEKVAKLIEHTRDKTLQEAAKACRDYARRVSEVGARCASTDDSEPAVGRIYLALGAKMAAIVVEGLAYKTKGCALDTDNDGNCHVHPTGCPK